MSKHRHEVVVSIVLYAVCSSVMLVINKVTISLIPIPGAVFVAQFLATFAGVMAGKGSGALVVDDLTAEKAFRFAPYTCAFVAALYCNGKVLQHSNVETLITFRACSPLCVSILDWVFLGRELPSMRSTASLLGVLAGAAGYVACDSEFKMHGAGAYGWSALYLVVIVFEMTYAKHTISNIHFQSAVWGSVLYSNALASPLMVVLALGSGEGAQLAAWSPTPGALSMLLLCCMLGICINWSGWNCRSQISAAAYTLLGVVCKLVSVLLNVVIWDKHASITGILWLVVCLVSSSFYRQAPLRAGLVGIHARADPK